MHIAPDMGNVATMERPKSLLQSEIIFSQRSVGCHAAYDGKHSVIPPSSGTQAVALQEPWHRAAFGWSLPWFPIHLAQVT